MGGPVPKTVLIVEDEFLIALNLTLLLEGHGWHVLGPAATVDEALRLLDDEQPTVALLDLTLKDGTVAPLAEALRARDVPFIMASALSPTELIGGDVLAGAPHVGKPTDERRLLAVLKQLVR